MADKKLVTYDCTLSFSFQTKDDDFMNSDFNFDHISVACDVSNCGFIYLFGNSNAKYPIIISCLHNVLFSCVPVDLVDLTAADVFNSVLSYQGLESLGDCVFAYQSVKGSRFFLGVREKEFLNEKNKIESSEKPEKFPRRCRNKKA